MIRWTAVALAVTVSAAAEPNQRSEDATQTAPAIVKLMVRPLGGGAYRHSSPVAQLAYTPDQKLMVTVTTDGVVSLWDAVTAKLLRRVHPKLGPIASMAVSADSQHLALGSFQGKLSLTDLPKLSRFLNVPISESPVDALAFSPNGRQLACAVGTGIHLRASKDLAKVKELAGHKHRVRDLAYTNGGGRLVSVDEGGVPWLWDLDHGKGQPLDRPAELAAVRLVAVAPAPKGNLCLAVGEQGAAWLWSTRTGKFLHAYKDPRLPKGTTVGEAAWLPQTDHFVTVGTRQPICMWNRRTGKVVRTFGPWRRPATRLAVGAGGKSLAVAVGHNVRVLEVGTGRDLLPAPVGHDRVVHALAVADGGTRFLSVGADSEAILWDFERRARLWSFHANGPIVAAAALPERKGLLTGDIYGAVSVHDPADGQVRLTLAGHTKPIVSLAPIAKSTQVISASRDGVVVLSDVAGGKMPKTHRVPGVECMHMTLVPDSRDCLVVTREASPATTQPQAVRVRVERWNLDTGKRHTLLSLPENYAGGLAVGPTDPWFAVHDADQRVRFHGLADGKLLRSTPPLPSAVRVLSVSPGGTRLAAGLNGTRPAVQLINTADATLGQSVRLPAPPTAIRFLPDGATLLVGCQDGSLMTVELARP